MTQKKSIIHHDDVKAALQHDTDFRQPLIQRIVQEVLEVEMEQCLHASKGERTDARLGYRSGYYSRRLITRVGQIELRVPQDRQGHFRTSVTSTTGWMPSCRSGPSANWTRTTRT